MATAPKFQPRVLTTSTTTGNSTLTVSGTAITGYQAFSSFTDGDNVYFVVYEVDGSGVPSGGWEEVLGVVGSSGTTLTIGTVYGSSAGTGTAVSWSGAGTRRVANIQQPTSLIQYPTIETAMTADTTLTAAAYGKAYLITITSAGITATLPAAANHTGETIRFRVAGSSTKLLTLDGNSSETIDGALTRIMWAGESCTIVSDGTNWTKIGGRTLPMTCKIQRSTAMASPIATATVVQITLDTTVYDNSGLLANLGSNQIVIKRPGTYTIGGLISYDNLGLANAAQTRIHKNGTSISASGGPSQFASYPAYFAGGQDVLAAADTLDLWAYQTSGSNANIQADIVNWLYVGEIPTW